MASFTVTSEAIDSGSRDEHGNVVWALDLESVGAVKLHKRVGNKPPGKGMVVNGNLKHGRLFLDKPSENGGERRSRGDGGPRHNPDERRSIERQVSAKIAADLVPFDAEKIKTWAEQFRWVTDQVHAAIQGEAE